MQLFRFWLLIFLVTCSAQLAEGGIITELLCSLLSIFCKEQGDDPCKPDTCQYGGKCYSNDKSDFNFCLCPFPTGGIRCEIDLTCRHCARQDDIVLFVFNDESVSAETAEARCKAMGYQIHMPKSAYVYNFTSTYLLNNYPRNTPTLQGYRIGLSRDNNEADWLWADGTVLGSYTPWAPGQPDIDVAAGEPDSKSCVVIWNEDRFEKNWDDSACDLSLQYTYYFVCEKRYDFYV